MRENLLTIMSGTSTIISLISEYMPVIQLLAVIIAIASGIGAIHLTLLKITLANKQLKK